jgi:regulator of sigma E protease
MLGITLVSFAVLIGILIFIHEFGHFIVAKCSGVGVERFQLGFGKKIVGRKWGETEYRLSLIPLGGLVKLVGESDAEDLSPEDKKRSFFHQPVWKRMAIVVAGPFFNLMLAIIIYFIVFIIGVPGLSTTIGIVQNGLPASISGIKTGDVVISINGEKVKQWANISKIVDKSQGRELVFSVKRGNDLLDVKVKPKLEKVKNIFGEDVQEYTAGLDPELTTTVGDISEDLPAYKAGMKSGDEIVAIDGKKISEWENVSKMINNGKGQDVVFTLKRGSKILDLRIKPKAVKERSSSGAMMDHFIVGIAPAEKNIIVRMNPLESSIASIEQTWFFCKLTMKSIIKIFEGVVSPKTLGGPILIAQIAGTQAKAGIIKFIMFMAFLSINLAVLNLLPIPVLDGGHLLFFVIELIIRRPVSMKIREIATQFGFLMLILLMIFVIMMDIDRLNIQWINDIMKIFK